MNYRVKQKKDGRYYPQERFLFFWWIDCIDLSSKDKKPVSYGSRIDAEQYVYRNYLSWHR